MSPPDTDIDKQTERHKAPLFGMGVVVAFAGLLFVGLVFWTISQGETEPETTVTAPVVTID